MCRGIDLQMRLCQRIKAGRTPDPAPAPAARPAAPRGPEPSLAPGGLGRPAQPSAPHDRPGPTAAGGRAPVCVKVPGGDIASGWAALAMLVDPGESWQVGWGGVGGRCGRVCPPAEMVKPGPWPPAPQVFRISPMVFNTPSL